MNANGSTFKHPRWSLTSSFLVAAGLIAIVTFLIIFIVRKSIWVKPEILSLALAPVIFVYMLARYRVANERYCKSSRRKSVFYALLYSGIYSMWLYLIIFTGHYVLKLWRK